MLHCTYERSNTHVNYHIIIDKFTVQVIITIINEAVYIILLITHYESHTNRMASIPLSSD